MRKPDTKRQKGGLKKREVLIMQKRTRKQLALVLTGAMAMQMAGFVLTQKRAHLTLKTNGGAEVTPVALF